MTDTTPPLRQDRMAWRRACGRSVSERTACLARSLRRSQAPTLLVGGTADRMWDSGVVGGLGHDVLEVPSADHSLELGDDVAGSVEVLRQVVARLDGFIGSLGSGVAPPR